VLPVAPSGFWLFGIRYFALEALPPAHWRAPAHFLQVSRLMFARDLGRGTARASARSEYLSHCTLRVSGFSAAIFAHSSAFSLPLILL